MIISMDTEETFDRAQGPFMLKPLRKVVEGNFLNLTEYQQKPTASIIPDRKRLNAFFPTLGMGRGCPLSLLPLSITPAVLADTTRQEKEIRAIRTTSGNSPSGSLTLGTAWAQHPGIG